MKRIHFIVMIVIALACYGINPRVGAVDALVPFSAGTNDLGIKSSCSNPTGENFRLCQETEKAMLASTVRIEFFLDEPDGYGGTKRSIREISLGTIKDGRFLVTHNHFGHLLIEDVTGQKNNIRFSLYTAAGEVILTELPLTSLSIRREEAGTLVLDLGLYSSNDIGQSTTGGLFELLSLPSAQFRAWPLAALQAGVEVAQVQWDGTHTFVKWVQIEGIKTEGGISMLKLASLPQHGSSGGGIFWNGYHIGNTLSHTLEYNKLDGRMIAYYSTAVLNSPITIASLETKNTPETLSSRN